MPVDHAKVGVAGGHARHALNRFGSHTTGVAVDFVAADGRVVLEIAQPVGRATPQWDEAAFRTEATALAREYNQEHGSLIDHVTFWTGVVPEFENIR